MKNFIKTRIASSFGIIALSAIIVFSMANCEDGGEKAPHGPDATAFMITTTSKSLKIGEEFTPSYTVVPADAPIVSWVSEDTSVATVDKNGNITAKGLGTTKITATAKGGKTSSCTVTGTLDLKNVAESPFTSTVSSIVYGNGKFVAGASSSDKIAHSINGYEWEAVDIGFDGTGIEDIVYGDGIFVAVGGWEKTNSRSKISTSKDGIAWTLRTSPFGTSERIYSAASGNNTIVIAAYNKIAYSTDGGDSWTSSTSPTNGIESIAYGNGKFVICAYDFYYSDDAASWTKVTDEANILSKAMAITVYGNGRFIAGTATGNIRGYSEDGINWTAITLTDNPFSAKTLNSITFGDGLFFAANNLGFSRDGENWTTAISSSNIWSLAIGNNILVAGHTYGGLSYAALK